MSERGRGRPPGTSHDAIRDAALALFLKNGYADTTLESIAQSVGISRTTLFSYFKAKRDLIWEDYDQLSAGIEEAMLAAEPRPVVDLIVHGLLASARFRVEDHAILCVRMQIVEDDYELRAFAALGVQDTMNRIAAGATQRANEADPVLIDMVTRALVASASRCVEEWASHDCPEVDLDDYTAGRIRPLVDALRPLLP